MKRKVQNAKKATAAALLILMVGSGRLAASVPPDSKVVATVGEQAITLADVISELGFIHRGMSEAESTDRANRVATVLDRLVNIRLAVLEAKAIGLDDLPEVREGIEGERIDVLRSLLLGQIKETVPAGESAVVEQIYRNSVKEVRTRSVLTANVGQAKRLSESLRAGGDFAQLANALVAEDGAQKGDGGDFVRVSELRPEVAAALDAMAVGETSEPIPLGEGFAVVQLLEERYPEDAAARESAEASALQKKRGQVLKTFFADLEEKYVRVDEEVFSDLDFEAPAPGFASLERDERVVARVEGADPVTVADVAAAIASNFFHGTDRAAQDKKINRRKRDFLEAVLIRRLTLREAKARGLDRSEEYRRRMTEFERGILFSTFVKRVIDADLHVTEETLRDYYRRHKDEYTEPEAIRLEELAFERREDAEEALSKLRRGADFGWVRSSSDGQVPRDSRPDLLVFGKLPVPRPMLPEGVNASLGTVSPGDYRLHAPETGPFYVLHVLEVVPAKTMPFDQATPAILEGLIREQRETALASWGEKLRSAYKVRTLVSEDELKRLVLERIASTS